jgi:hypothetical protein
VKQLIKFMENEFSPEIAAIAAKENRRQKLDRAVQEVGEKYPELKERIVRSLETPQIGEYHNEGPTMDYHLGLILDNLENIKNGEFDEAAGLNEELRETFKSAVVKRDPETGEEKVNDVLVDYAILHDIAKPDCMTLKVEGEKKGIEIAWERWQNIKAAGEPYQIDGKPIKSISYFHASEETAGQHGNKGAKSLEGKNIPPEIVVAISKHEVAYQFPKINASTYEEHFVKPGYSDEQQKLILVASYIDTAASLRVNGKPDFANFNFLVRSRENYLLIRKFMERGLPYRENDLNALKKQDKVLTETDLEKLIVKEEKYNTAVLAEKLGELVVAGTITGEEKEAIVSLAQTAPKDIGKKFGPKMKAIKPILEQSKI